MESIWNECRIFRKEQTLRAQAAVEGEVPFPEGREGARLVDYSGSVQIRESRIRGDSLFVEGRIALELLGESREGELFNYSSRAAFSYSLKAPVSLEGMEAEVKAQLQSLQIQGGTHVKAIVDLRGDVVNESPVRLFGGRKGDGGLQTETETIRTEKKCPLGPLHFRIRGEASVPGLQSVIRARGNASLREIRNNGDSLELTGVLRLKALCKSGDGRLFQAEQHIPFQETVEGDFPRGMLMGEVFAEQLSARAAGEEPGFLHLEAKLICELFKKEEQETEVLRDAYSLTEPFTCLTERLQIRNYLGEMHFRRSILESLDLPEGMPEAARMLCVSLRPLETDSAAGEGKLRAEGVLFGRVLYLGTDEKLHAFSSELPFSIEEALPEQADEVRLHLQAEGSVSGAGRKLELSISLYGTADLYSHRETELITEIKEAELSPVKSGLLVVFAREGERLFSIAKACNTTREKILELDPALPELCREGQPVVMLL